MNPDNPNFRTPEEAKRAEKYAKLVEQNKLLITALERIVGYDDREIPDDVVAYDMSKTAREALAKIRGDK